MKIGKLQIGHIYEVIWIDNNIMDQTGWVTLKELQDYATENTECLIRSCGILHAQDKIFITLVGDQDLAQSAAAMRPIKILKNCICYIKGHKPKLIKE